MRQDVTIRRSQEITIAGKTQVRELYARGYYDQDGRLRLTACVGCCATRPPLRAASKPTERAA